ncbi:4Fe-4S dicluster domain-containing protein [Desulfofundulus sp.]|uniref:4Fe-4S dicluster domain-containing protein n=1 Tax=Desulfofundulus sp. TaxID=2282750 RepID=UPI003C784592
MTQSFEARTIETQKSFWTIFPGLCKGCGLCMQKCPRKCLAWSDVLGVYGTPSVEANEECNGCGICQMVCPDCAITVTKKKEEKKAG